MKERKTKSTSGNFTSCFIKKNKKQKQSTVIIILLIIYDYDLSLLIIYKCDIKLNKYHIKYEKTNYNNLQKRKTEIIITKK